MISEISNAGVSIWLDDLSRERMVKGGKSSYLPDLIAHKHVVGVTTNPAIFSNAISTSQLYRQDIIELRNQGLNVEEIITELTCSDVKEACGIFLDTFEKTNGIDGRVSIEVDPRYARDTEKTVAQARDLWNRIGAPNLLIKVPATKEGLPAIRELIADGISVNVTIIFSVSRYREVLEAYQNGISDRATSGKKTTDTHSVASFFVSRVDTEIDARLKKIGRLDLLGKAAIANARLAYKEFVEVKASPNWQKLAASGALLQRPLWASTGVKEPSYDPAMYVTELIASETVNTMPESTLIAASQTVNFKGDSITGNFDSSTKTIDELGGLGIDIEEVARKLEEEGIEKFVKPWLELISVVATVSA